MTKQELHEVHRKNKSMETILARLRNDGHAIPAVTLTPAATPPHQRLQQQQQQQHHYQQPHHHPPPPSPRLGSVSSSKSTDGLYFPQHQRSAPPPPQQQVNPPTHLYLSLLLFLHSLSIHQLKRNHSLTYLQRGHFRPPSATSPSPRLAPYNGGSGPLGFHPPPTPTPPRSSCGLGGSKSPYGSLSPHHSYHSRGPFSHSPALSSSSAYPGAGGGGAPAAPTLGLSNYRAPY